MWDFLVPKKVLHHNFKKCVSQYYHLNHINRCTEFPKRKHPSLLCFVTTTLASELHEVSVSKLQSSLSWSVCADQPWRVFLECSRVDTHMLTASHKNLGSKTLGEWYEEGERLQRTRCGVIERWNRERGSAYIWSCWWLPCQGPHRHFISFLGFDLSWCGKFLPKKKKKKRHKTNKANVVNVYSWNGFEDMEELKVGPRKEILKSESFSPWFRSRTW